MAYLDPKNDLTFKKVFGEHPDLLKSLLNALLPLEEGRLIESLEYLLDEKTPVFAEFNVSLIQVCCYDNHNESFIVKLNILWTDRFAYRMEFVNSEALVSRILTRIDLLPEKPVFFLNFIDEHFQPDNTKFFHYYPIVSFKDYKRRIRGIEFLFIELPKYKDAVGKHISINNLWLRFLTEIKDGSRNIPEWIFQNEDIKKAHSLLNEDNFTQREIVTYDRYWDMISMERSVHYDLTKKPFLKEKEQTKN